ncbi:MAG: helix-hairpin-helix domain-containing protein [Candidatus Competibacterales bacterium]|nr:helix-hairpin-helix domain-containing protein [Candidatus Competibacterales bacterium]
MLVLFTSLVMAQPVNVNTATAEELTALDGIGPVKAEAIIQYREASGPFESPEQS